MKDVVAIGVSDLHLSAVPPLVRSCEPDWWKTQALYLDQLEQLGQKYDAPILCAGDVFDKWNTPVDFVNFIISKCPQMYAVTGQHDLPFHQYGAINRSAYWTLVEARIIYNMPSVEMVGAVSIQGFPFGFEIKPRPRAHDLCINIALIHKYCWVPGKSYKGAPIEGRLKTWKKKLRGYDVAIVGDNHKTFLAKCGDCKVVNTGTFMRRKSDEMDHRPCVALIGPHGEVELEYLDCSQDKFIEAPQDANGCPANFDELCQELREVADSPLEFKEMLLRALTYNKVREPVKAKVHKALGNN